MKWWIWAIGVVYLCVGGVNSFAQQVTPEVLAKYITKEGKLTYPVEVRDEKKGFGIFAGTHYRVAQDGSWVVTGIYLNQVRVVTRGKLTEEQLEKLAYALAAQDALALPNVGTPYVNPHVVSVFFGPARGYLTFGVDQMLPKVETKPEAPRVPAFVKPTPGQAQFLPGGVVTQPEVNALTRYAAIQTAVKTAIVGNYGKPLPAPNNPRLANP